MRFVSRREPGPATPYSHYLRTGRWPGPIEHKFNPNHDPHDGRFINKAGGSGPAPGAKRTGVDASAQSHPANPQTRHKLGSLSAKYESRGNPGTVSTGARDRGGISYGTYQFSTDEGTAAAFVASSEARPWAKDFQGLSPGSPEFSARWRAVADRDPEGFGVAQEDYVQRTHYDPAVARVKRNTGLDLNGESYAVRSSAFSVAVQHGAAPAILTDAVRATDRSTSRTDRNYDASLIDNIYEKRTAFVTTLRDRALARHDVAHANTYNELITHRYPSERADAHLMLSKGHP